MTSDSPPGRLAGRLKWLSTGSDRRFVVACLVSGALLRIVALRVTLAKGWTYMDLDEVMVARAIKAGLGFSFHYYDLFGDPLTPGAFFPPAYVYNVYVLLRIFGSDMAIYVQNVLLSLGVSLLIYMLGARLFDRATARLGLVLSLVYVPFFSRLTHGSPAYFKMFFVCLLILLLCQSWSKRSRSAFFWPGVTGGFLALSMPDVLAYVALIAPAIALRDRCFRWRGRQAAVFVFAVAVVIAPWTARNWIGFERFCLISSNGGFNLYMGHNAETKGEVSYAHVARLNKSLNGELARADEFTRDEILYSEAFRYIRTHPLETTRNVLKRGVLHWAFRPTFLKSLVSAPGDYERLPIPYVWSYALAYGCVLLLGAYGVWLSRRDRRKLTPVLLMFACSTMVSMLFLVQTKQRLSKVEPFLLIFAAYGVVSLLRRRRLVPPADQQAARRAQSLSSVPTTSR